MSKSYFQMFQRQKGTLTVVIEERKKRVITRRVSSPIPIIKPKKETCDPINTLEELLEWKPKLKNWADKVVPKVQRSSNCFKWSKNCDEYIDNQLLVECRESVPKTLYCHDMKGGYLEDKYVKGCTVDDAFTFFRWSGIDIFVYFSHSLITIPTLGWINAAHINGVSILGTIITEGDKGKEILQKILKDDKTIENFCLKVAQIAQQYKFSGYLLNFENNISSNLLPNFIEMIVLLRKELKKINPDNIVIWYDSVTTPDGKLSYQNELNDQNCTFFDITDGIFLNYNWKEKNLVFSKRFAEKRASDVFVGIDVFGRGCYGGGGFNSCLAINEIRKYNLSAAIFAPGWVFECQNEKDPFLIRDYSFWKSIFPHLYISGPSDIPFRTSFSTGMGKNYYLKGQIYTEGPWYNLSRQGFQISDVIPWEGTKDDCISYYDLDAYNGGNCILLKSQHFERLFYCDFKLNKSDLLMITFVIKSFEEDKGELELLVKYEDKDSVQKNVVLEYSIGTEEANNWRKRKYLFGPCEATITELACKLMRIDQLLIGEVSVKKAKDSKDSLFESERKLSSSKLPQLISQISGTFVGKSKN